MLRRLFSSQQKSKQNILEALKCMMCPITKTELYLTELDGKDVLYSRVPDDDQKAIIYELTEHGYLNLTTENAKIKKVGENFFNEING